MIVLHHLHTVYLISLFLPKLNEGHFIAEYGMGVGGNSPGAPRSAGQTEGFWRICILLLLTQCFYGQIRPLGALSVSQIVALWQKCGDPGQTQWQLQHEEGNCVCALALLLMWRYEISSKWRQGNKCTVQI